MKHNPYAYAEILKRLYEAYRRGLWKTSQETIENIVSEFKEIESYLEERIG